MELKKYDVLVIGSGISGLTSALLFAKKGKKVAIAEQAANIAPLISGFDRKSGGHNVHFETGFHYSAGFGEKEVGSLLLKELGLEVPFEACDENNYDEIHILNSEKVFRVPFGKQKLEEKLAEFFPEEKKNIKAYLELVYETVKNIPFLNKSPETLSREDLLTFFDDGKTLKEVLDKHFKSEELKELFSYAYILHGTPPSKVSFALHCSCTGLMADSVWKIKGGAQTLINAYAGALKKYNIDTFTKKKAVKIEVEKGEKKVYFEDGTEIGCDICVSSIHPKELIKIAPGNIYRKNGAERIEKIEETPSFFALYGVLPEKEKYNCTNMAFMGGAEKEGFSGESPAYINFSDTDPQAVCVVAFVKPDEVFWDRKESGYKERKRALADKIKAETQKLCPEIAAKIQYCDSASPATYKSYVNYFGGYGIMHDAADVKILPATKVPGIFLTGQAVVTPGLLGALISSFLLDKLI